MNFNTVILRIKVLTIDVDHTGETNDHPNCHIILDLLENPDSAIARLLYRKRKWNSHILLSRKNHLEYLSLFIIITSYLVCNVTVFTNFCFTTITHNGIY